MSNIYIFKSFLRSSITSLIITTLQTTKLLTFFTSIICHLFTYSSTKQRLELVITPVISRTEVSQDRLVPTITTLNKNTTMDT